MLIFAWTAQHIKISVRAILRKSRANIFSRRNARMVHQNGDGQMSAAMGSIKCMHAEAWCN